MDNFDRLIEVIKSAGHFARENDITTTYSVDVFSNKYIFSMRKGDRVEAFGISALDMDEIDPAEFKQELMDRMNKLLEEQNG